MLKILWSIFRNKYVAAAVLLLVIAGGAWAWYERNENTLERLEEEKVALEEVNKAYAEELTYKEQRINSLTEDYEIQLDETKKLQSRYSEAREYSNQLIDKLQQHDLAYLALKKPGLIENRINKATVELFNEFEQIGSDISPDDSN